VSIDREHMEELFEPLDGVSIRGMFGGLGVFKDGLMFACVVDDTLRFKADETTAPEFEMEGCRQWVYRSRDRDVAMPYWTVPERLFDEPDAFAEWAKQAFAVAVRTRKAGKKTGAAKRPAIKRATAARARKKPG
jgi:DNA transformation protein and related proteins